MTRWVALLRAVNLGARNKVPMAHLREALEAGGLQDVSTYIASGNVLFRSRASDRKRLARRIERVIREELGVDTVVALRTGVDLEALLDAHPFGKDTSKSSVTFLVEEPAAAAARALRQHDVAPDRIELRGADVLLHLPNGIQGAQLAGAALERLAGVQGTNRNWRTVAKLAELAQGG